jgi:hypothetical protein
MKGGGKTWQQKKPKHLQKSLRLKKRQQLKKRNKS